MTEDMKHARKAHELSERETRLLMLELVAATSKFFGDVPPEPFTAAFHRLVGYMQDPHDMVKPFTVVVAYEDDGGVYTASYKVEAEHYPGALEAVKLQSSCWPDAAHEGTCVFQGHHDAYHMRPHSRDDE